MKIFGIESYIEEKSADLKPNTKWTWTPAKLALIKNPKSLLNYNSVIEAHLEKKFARGYTLLISRKNVQTGALIQQLKKLKKPFLYLNWDDFVGEGTVLYNSAEKKYLLGYKKKSYDLSKVRSVYFDHSDIAEAFFYKRAKFLNSEKLFLARWQESLLTLERVLGDAKWFPAKPSDMRYESQNKFAEGLLAKKCGFKIPKMIYTNDSREAQKFLFQYPSVLKESGLKFLENAKGKVLIFKTNKIDPMDKKLSFVNSTPCLFQEFIEKKCDIRAVVFGDRVLACKIDSQTNKKAAVDWRGAEGLAPFSPITLPRDIQKKLMRFQKVLRFSFSSFDLVISQKNEYVFLEMNRPGQWLFIEALSGVAVAKTLAKKM